LGDYYVQYAGAKIYTEWLTIFQSYLKWSEWDTAGVRGYTKIFIMSGKLVS